MNGCIFSNYSFWVYRITVLLCISGFIFDAIEWNEAFWEARRENKRWRSCKLKRNTWRRPSCWGWTAWIAFNVFSLHVLLLTPFRLRALMFWDFGRCVVVSVFRKFLSPCLDSACFVCQLMNKIWWILSRSLFSILATTYLWDDTSRNGRQLICHQIPLLPPSLLRLKTRTPPRRLSHSTATK